MNRTPVILISGLLPVFIAGCESPANYRPEVDQFATATAEAAKYLESQRTRVSALRSKLRRQVLSRTQPKISTGTGCQKALLAFSETAAKPNPMPLSSALVEDCQFQFLDNFPHQELFNPAEPIRNSIAFSDSVANYASALNKVATIGDREGFIKAVDGLGDAAASLASNAAKAVGKEPPDTAALGPIANLVANAAFYFLENKRADALKTAATTAKPWIDSGSAAVVRVIYSMRFELINQANDDLQESVDAVNEAQANQYPDKADEAISSLGHIRNLLSGDPGATFRALPKAHDALMAAFDDRKRHVDGAIAAAKNLFEAARAARAALVNKQG